MCIRDRLQEEILRNNKTRQVGEYNNWEYLKDKALGSISHPDDVYKLDWQVLNKRSYEQIRRYIENKSL